MRKMFGRNFRTSVGAVSVISVLALTACSSGGTEASASGSHWKFELVADVTGPLGVTFGPAAAGFQSYIAMINDQGGVAGRKIDLEVQDGQSTTAAGLAAGQKALAAEPIGVFQLGSSASAAALQPQISNAGVSFFSQSLSDSNVYPAKKDVFLVLGISATQQAQANVAHIKDKLGDLKGKTIALMGASTPLVDSVIATETKLLTDQGATVGVTQRYELGVASFAAQAGSVVSSHPDAIAVLGAASDTVTVVTSLYSAGLTAPTVAWTGGSSPDVISKIANAKYSADTDVKYPAGNTDFLAATAKYGFGPQTAGSSFSGDGWAQAATAVEALRLCGDSCTSTTYGAAAEKVTNFKVPTGVAYGPISLSATNHVGASAVQFHTWDVATHSVVDDGPVVSLSSN